MNERKLKVSYNTRENGTTYKNRQTKFIPKIILAGNWLEKAGFGIGEFTKILVTSNYIQIIKDKTTQEGGSNGADR